VHRVLYDSDYFEQSNLARNLFKFLKGLSCVLYESDYFEQPVTKKKKITLNSLIWSETCIGF
jgi:hypothetical protein